MRADIARIVNAPPEALAADDNLMDWGLDSLRLLNLVMGWNEAGLKLDISQLAEHLTLKGMWKAIERAQKAA